MREEIYTLLKEITPNVFQQYPNKEEEFPCLVFDFSVTGNPELEGIGYFEGSLGVEIYSKTSSKRSELEIKLITELIKYGWVNVSNYELPHPDYYRNKLSFEKTYQGGN